MSDTYLEESPDRIVLELKPGGPMELTGRSDSFAALARYYERHYRPDDAGLETAPKLFVTRLETGSIIAEIAPYAVFFGQMLNVINAPVIVANFTQRFVSAVRAFIDPAGTLSKV